MAPSHFALKDNLMNRAFTLLELLIVLGIVSLLAAILFPVLVKVRETGRRSQCSSNIRQLGVAVESYLADFDNRYPFAWGPDAVRRGKTPGFPAVMMPYVLNQTIFECPSDIGETFPSDRVNGWGSRTIPFKAQCPGAMSYLYRGIDKGYYAIATRKTSDIRKPSITVLLQEARPWHGYNVSDKFVESPGRYNVLYCDGHVARDTYKEWWANMNLCFQR